MEKDREWIVVCICSFFVVLYFFILFMAMEKRQPSEKEWQPQDYELSVVEWLDIVDQLANGICIPFSWEGEKRKTISGEFYIPLDGLNPKVIRCLEEYFTGGIWPPGCENFFPP